MSKTASLNANAKALVILYGRHAVLAALQNPSRQVQKLVCTKDFAMTFRRQYPQLNIVTAEKKEIDKLLPNSVHQGLALYCKPLETTSLEELCARLENKSRAIVLVLDGLTDPQNVGAIIRTCAAFGVAGLIVQDKNAPLESGAMAKAAAGTLEWVPLVRVTNLSHTLELLKKHGFWSAGMDAHAKAGPESLDKNTKWAIVMGSEGAGMRRLVKENCDVTVRLPINERVESLNVSTAAAIMIYELQK